MRRKEIRGQVVEEFYWGGKPVVYVNGDPTEDKFTVACDKIVQAFGAIDRMKEAECHKK